MLEKQNKELSLKTTLAMLIIFFLVIILVACGGAISQPTEVAQPTAEVTPGTTKENGITEEPSNGEIPILNCDLPLSPEICNPEWEAQIIYTPLMSLPTIDCEKRLLSEGPGRCVALTYNNNRQDFRITVEGSSAEVVMNYINASKAYFLVQKLGNALPTGQDTPSAADILRETVVEYTKYTQSELNAKRNEMGEVTLADVITSVSADPGLVDIILEAANAKAQSAFEAAGFSAEDINAIPDEMKTMMYEAGAGVIYDMAMFPLNDEEYMNLLLSDPNALVISMEWANAPQEDTGDLWVVWYSIDPPTSFVPPAQATVGPYASQSYKEKCNVYSASAGIRSIKNSMTLSFWRVVPTKLVGTRVADIQRTAAPPTMSHSSYPTKTKYDAKVVGGPSGGTYYIYGGWVQGYGCQ